MESNSIIQGDTVEELKKLPDNCVDLIFADPPYNLQLRDDLHRPNTKKYDGVDDNWDKFENDALYDDFSRQWLEQCRRVLKKNGTIWVIGTYHNIFRIGKIMLDLGFWILNDILWVKTNPTPNFNGTRFTNAHETLIWAKRSKNQKKYTFNYRLMKNLNGEKQMRSDWLIPICMGEERLRENGVKVHPTQKPEALLRRVILASSNPDDLILDPFFGSGTTGAVAKQLNRNWLGIERDEYYINKAMDRIDKVKPISDPRLLETYSKRKLPSVSMGSLIEVGMIDIGTTLQDKSRKYFVTVKADGTVTDGVTTGSIHKMGAFVQEKTACNGWTFWFIQGKELIQLDALRDKYRREVLGLQIERVL